MLFVFTVRPYVGHFYPVVPVARALQNRGHEVVIATGAALEATVRGAGFEPLSAGLDPRLPLPAEVTDRSQRPDYGVFATRCKTLDVMDWSSRRGPDVLVREPTDFSGLLVAEALGRPHVTLGMSHFMSAAFWARLLDGTLDIIRTELGLPPDPQLDRLFAYLYLDTVPPWFYPAGPPKLPGYVSLAPSLFDGGPRSAVSTAVSPTPPSAYVTLGTVYNRVPHFFRVVCQALASEAVSVVCTVGDDQDPSEVVPTPPSNARVVRYLPQSALMAGCRAVVCHGGYSTVMIALCAGVPVLAIPRGSDQLGNAQRCQQLGAGLLLDAEQFNEAAVRRAVRRLLTESTFRQRAGELGRQAAVLPGPDQAALLLERLPTLVETEADLTLASARLLASGNNGWLGNSGTDRPVRGFPRGQENFLEQCDSVSEPGRAAPPATSWSPLVETVQSPGVGEDAYRRVNGRAWDALAGAGSDSSRPYGPAEFAGARQWLDSNDWLPWDALSDVLCLASGGGQQGPMFASLGKTVTVVDLSAAQLRRDAETAVRHGLDLTCVQADMLDLSGLGHERFDLVYQAVSACYVPDVRTLYRQVAAVLRPAGHYWVEHWSPTQMQLAQSNRWDGAAYRLVTPQHPRQPVPWISGHDDGLTVTCWHFVHPLADLLGGLGDSGFAILRVAERGHADLASTQGSEEHLAAFVPPFLRLLARRYP